MSAPTRLASRLVEICSLHRAPNFEEKIQYVQEHLLENARDYFGDDVALAIELQEGSSFLNVLIAVAAITTILSNGPDALKNLQKAIHWSHETGSEVIDTLKGEFAISDNEILWKQKRTGDLARYRPAANFLDELTRSKDVPGSTAQINNQRKLLSYFSKIPNLEQDHEAIQILLDTIPRDRVPNFPNTPEELRVAVLRGRKKQGADQEYVVSRTKIIQRKRRTVFRSVAGDASIFEN